jgi:hypothetical protein
MTIHLNNLFIITNFIILNEILLISNSLLIYIVSLIGFDLSG